MQSTSDHQRRTSRFPKVSAIQTATNVAGKPIAVGTGSLAFAITP